MQPRGFSDRTIIRGFLGFHLEFTGVWAPMGTQLLA